MPGRRGVKENVVVLRGHLRIREEPRKFIKRRDFSRTGTGKLLRDRSDSFFRQQPPDRLNQFLAVRGGGRLRINLNRGEPRDGPDRGHLIPDRLIEYLGDVGRGIRADEEHPFSESREGNSGRGRDGGLSDAALPGEEESVRRVFEELQPRDRVFQGFLKRRLRRLSAAAFRPADRFRGNPGALLKLPRPLTGGHRDSEPIGQLTPGGVPAREPLFVIDEDEGEGIGPLRLQEGGRLMVQDKRHRLIREIPAFSRNAVRFQPVKIRREINQRLIRIRTADPSAAAHRRVKNRELLHGVLRIYSLKQI